TLVGNSASARHCCLTSKKPRGHWARGARMAMRALPHANRRAPEGARRTELWRRCCGTRCLVERVSAGARTVDVRVVDGEARLLQGLQPIDAAPAEVGGRHPVHPHGDTIGHGLNVAIHGTVVEVE